METYPPYRPMSSLGHELGVMFGFIASCLLTMAVYAFFWRASQRRAARKDLARRKDLHARGFHRDRGGLHEKMLAAASAPFPPSSSSCYHRVELPVHHAAAAALVINEPDEIRRSPTPASTPTTGGLTNAPVEVSRDLL